MNSLRSGIAILDGSLIEERDYWVKELREREEGVKGIGRDYVRRGGRGEEEEEGREEFAIEGEAYERLEEITGGKAFLEFTVMLAGVKVWLYKYGSGRSQAVGTPALKEGKNGREKANAVVVKDEMEGGMRFKEYLMRLREQLLEVYTKQRYPIRKLMGDLGMEEGGERCGLFDVAVEMEGMHGELAEVNNDIRIRIRKREGRIEGEVRYSKLLYEEESIRRKVEHLKKVIEEGVKEPEGKIGKLRMESEEELEQVVREWNRTERRYEEVESIQEMISETARRRGKATALEMGMQMISYEELEGRGNQVARYLIKKGVGAEEIVGVVMERGIEMIVGMLGVLKAGGAYLPMEAGLPKKRLEYMMREAGVKVVITQGHLKERVEEMGAEVVSIDREWAEIAEESVEGVGERSWRRNLAYVIYTSGTTGEPKGVMIEQGSLCNLVRGQIEGFGIGEGSRVLQYASTSFDASVSEIFTGLVGGGRLCLGTWEEMLPGRGLVQLLKQHAITTVTLPPTVMRAMRGEEEKIEVEVLVVAGEASEKELLKKWGRGRRLINAYGPTEATVCATMWEWEEGRERVRIGRGIGNVKVYIVDEEMEVVGVGVEGEILIGGAGVGRGYIGKGGETAEKYVPDWLSGEEGGRLYRTGDRGKYVGGGEIELVGRKDRQVKVRGYRIELEEVEEVLRGHERVRESAVIVKEDGRGEKKLVGYVEMREGEERVGREELQRYMKERVPGVHGAGRDSGNRGDAEECEREDREEETGGDGGGKRRGRKGEGGSANADRRGVGGDME